MRFPIKDEAHHARCKPQLGSRLGLIPSSWSNDCRTPSSRGAEPGEEVALVGGDAGVALQHVGMLVGRSAHRHLWPEIVHWIRARGGPGPEIGRGHYLASHQQVIRPSAF